MKKNNLDQIIHDANSPKEGSESATPTDMKAKESLSTSSSNPKEKDKDNFSRQVFRRYDRGNFKFLFIFTNFTMK